MIHLPIWGGHPHFKKCDLDQAFLEMIENADGALDEVEVHIRNPDELQIYTSRFPDLTKPKTIPKGQVWLPDIGPRKSLKPLSEIDSNGKLVATIKEFILTIPYDLKGPWKNGCPILYLARNGASLRIPTSTGPLMIYVEGREKETSSDLPYWLCKATLFPEKINMSHSDILASGGLISAGVKRLREDPKLKIKDIPDPIRTIINKDILFSIDFPLDAFN